MNRILAISVALACLLGAAAYAQDDGAADAPDDEFSRTGCYLGLAGAVAFSISAEDKLEDVTGSNADVSESLGLHARVGCRSSWIGAEIHFEWAEGFDAKAAGSEFEVEGWALTLDGKLYPIGPMESRLPRWARRFQPFATIGFGGLIIEEPSFIDDWEFAFRLGGGLDVYVTKNVAITVDATYVLPVSVTLDDLDYVSVGWGVLLRF
jgi:opacity protein-like surface antigen